MNKSARFYLTLPERTLRSLTSAVTGITSLTTKLLMPKFIKNSATYRVTFGMLQQFLIETVAEVKQEAPDIELKDNYVVRKTAGAFVEGIGLLSIHFSPVWMLAIVSDISGGSKEYLNRLIHDLKKNGIVKDEAKFNSVFDLLEGVRNSSKLGVDSIDMPPISKDEFLKLKTDMVKNFKDNGNQTKAIMKDLEGVWKQMHQVSKDENFAISKLNGTMTLDLMKKTATKGIDMTKATSETMMGLFNDVIIKSYKESINELSEHGKRKYVIDHLTPFMSQFSKHFDKNKLTMTDKLIDLFDGKKG